MKTRKIVLSSVVLAALALGVQTASAACDEISAADIQHLKAVVKASGSADTESYPFYVGKSSDTESYPFYTENCLKWLDEQTDKNKHAHSDINRERGT